MTILQRIKERFWWIDVVYPLALALFLLGVITAIVFAGRPSSRLALMAEQELLNLSLKLSPLHHAKNPGAVVIVTADVHAMRAFGKAPRGVTPDVTARTYADVVTQLGKLYPDEIVLFWHGDTQRFDAAYLDPLVATVEALPPETKFTIATAPEFIADVAARFAQKVRVVDDASCLYPDIDYTHSYCYFAEGWSGMLAQHLAEESIPAPIFETGGWLTHALPSNAATYITRLPPPAEITHLTFSAVLSGQIRLTQKPRMIFVGVDLSGALSSHSTGKSQRFVKTVYDTRKADATLVGTPSHVYWGQLAQVLLDRDLVKVPTRFEDMFLTGTFCLMILGVMIRFGGVAASGTFLTYGLTSPLVNALTLSEIDCYIPLFNSFYGGLSTLILSGFGRLSTTVWHKWRAQAKAHALREAAELKGHFISLLSHNLNTPVAKMQGMLALMSQFSPHELVTQNAHQAERLAARLQFAIRAVLIATALEEAEKALAPRTAKQLTEDFVAAYKGTLRKLGIEIRNVGVMTTGPGDDDLTFVPLHLDVRAVTMAVAGAAYLFAETEEEMIVTKGLGSIAIDLLVTARETRPPRDAVPADSCAGYGLAITVSAETAKISETVRTSLHHKSKHGIRGRIQGDFMQEVLSGLIAVTARSFQGHVTADVHAITLEIEGQTDQTM